MPRKGWRMRSFRYQIDGTEPGKWRYAMGNDRYDVAARVAAKRGPGTHTVYIQIGRATHANGSPMAVDAMTCVVEKRT